MARKDHKKCKNHILQILHRPEAQCLLGQIVSSFATLPLSRPLHQWQSVVRWCVCSSPNGRPGFLKRDEISKVAWDLLRTGVRTGWTPSTKVVILQKMQTQTTGCDHINCEVEGLPGIGFPPFMAHFLPEGVLHQIGQNGSVGLSSLWRYPRTKVARSRKSGHQFNGFSCPNPVWVVEACGSAHLLTPDVWHDSHGDSAPL